MNNVNDDFKIKEVIISHFRGYESKDNKFEFPEDKKVFILIGANGFGKTSFFDAIEWLFLGEVKRIKNNIDIKKDGKNPTEQTLINNINNLHKGVKASVEIKIKFDGQIIELLRKSIDYKKDFSIEQTNLFLRKNGEWQLINQDWINKKFTNKSSKNFDFNEKFSDYHFCSHERNLRVFHEKRTDMYSRLAILFGENKLDNYKKNIKLIVNKAEEEFKESKTIYDTFLENKKECLDEKNSLNETNYVINKYNKNKFFKEDVIENVLEDNLYNKLEKLNLLKYLYENKSKFKDYNNEMSYRNAKKNNDKFLSDIEKVYKQDAILIDYLKNDLFRLDKEKTEVENDIFKIRDTILNLNHFKYNSKKNYDIEKMIEKYGISDSRFSGKLDKNIKEDIQKINSLKLEAERFKVENENYKQTNSDLINLINYAKKYIEDNNDIKICPLCNQSTNLINLKEAIKSNEKILNEKDRKLAEVENNIKILNEKENKLFLFLKDELQLLEVKLTLKLNDINSKLNKKNKIINFNDELKKYNINIENINLESITNIKHSLNSNLEKIKSSIKEYTTNQNYTELKEFIEEYSNRLQNIKQFNLVEIDNETNLHSINDKINCINKIISNNSYKKEKEKLKELEKKKDYYEGIVSNVKVIEKKINETIRIIEKLNKSELEEPINYIYRKINRHTNFERININIASGKTDMIDPTIEKDKNQLNISNVLSSGQITTVALSFFLGIALKQNSSMVKAYFLDDPIQHMDDLNILSFFDLLRIHLQDSSLGNQLFISTCDEDVEELLNMKLKHYGIGVQKIDFQGYGDYKISM